MLQQGKNEIFTISVRILTLNRQLQFSSDFRWLRRIEPVLRISVFRAKAETHQFQALNREISSELGTFFSRR